MNKNEDINTLINNVESTDNFNLFSPLLEREILIKIINFLNRVIGFIDVNRK